MKIKKKILKNFFIQNILAFLAAMYIKIVLITSRIDIENQQIPFKYLDSNRPFILAFWHNQLMTISYPWSFEKRINILASGHRDGRFGAMIGKYFRLNNIPVSNKNRGVSLKPIFRLIKLNNYIGITPDGPRGPKEKVSEGIIKIAKTTNTHIIPIGFWSSKNLTLKSWDSFLVTLPFSKCSFVWGEALEVPNNLNDLEINKFQIILEKKINECILQAKKKIK